MPTKETRTYSRYTLEALKLLAAQIKTERLGRKITAESLAERAGISRGLLYRIEHADPTCGIGLVFEVAAILNISLFQSNYNDLLNQNKMLEDKLTLLPSRAKTKPIEIDDDF